MDSFSSISKILLTFKSVSLMGKLIVNSLMHRFKQWHIISIVRIIGLCDDADPIFVILKPTNSSWQIKSIKIRKFKLLF